MRLVLSGHEHNFQHAHRDGIDYFVTGGGGKVRTGRPGGFAEAGTVKWAPLPHFRLVKIEGDRAEVTPIGDDAQPLPTVDPAGRALDARTTV